MATESTHNGSAYRKLHNERDYDTCIKEEHIDLSRPHENWINKDPEEVYHELFDEALNEYNSKQKRQNRKIQDYYDFIEKDKKKKPVYEMIIGVYDYITSKETKKEIMKEFVDTWQERNPNLILIGAYYHDDELGKDPHVHIDYIPVGYDMTRGMKVQNSLSQALKQQGFYTGKKKITAQIAWEKRENQYLEYLCNQRNIEIVHYAKDSVHFNTRMYKEYQQQLDENEEKIYKLEQEMFENNELLSKNPEDGITDLREQLWAYRTAVRDLKSMYRLSFENNQHLKLTIEGKDKVIEAMKASTNYEKGSKLYEDNLRLQEQVMKLQELLDNTETGRTEYKEKYEKTLQEFNEFKDKFNDKIKFEVNKATENLNKLIETLKNTIQDLKNQIQYYKDNYVSKEKAEKNSISAEDYLNLLLENKEYQQREERITQYLWDNTDLDNEDIESIMNGDDLDFNNSGLGL